MAVPDPTPLADDWLFRGLSAIGAALLATGGTIFATRKNNEASVLKAVNERIDAQFKRQDDEIAELRRHVLDERAECDRKLKAMRDQIDALMGGPVPSYGSDHVDQAQRIGRAAVKRQRGKKP
jgi:hypothetical protein